MLFETYDYRIPEWAVCAIEYGDYSNLADEDAEQLGTFLASIPSNGHWSWGNNESDFSHYPEFGLACNVIDAEYLVPVEENL